MRIEIKKSDVLEEIYALSALKGYVNLPERERMLLQDDQSEGLSVLVADAFAETVIELMPRVERFGMPEENDDGDMWIELKDGYGATGIEAAVGALLTKTVACMVLAAIYEESGEGDAYSRRAMRGIDMARDTADSAEVRLRGWR